MIVSFTVFGEAAPQGSKIRNRYGGMRESSKRVQPWRDQVAQRAGEAMLGEELTGPVEVRLSFFLKRPKRHFGTGRNAEVLKPDADYYVTTSPDIDKCARAILDALTGVCFRDDAKVASLHAVKRYGHPARVEVELREIRYPGAALVMS